jgi:hypothetical protein
LTSDIVLHGIRAIARISKMAVRHPEVLAQAAFRGEFVRVLECYLLGGTAK